MHGGKQAADPVAASLAPTPAANPNCPQQPSVPAPPRHDQGTLHTAFVEVRSTSIEACPMENRFNSLEGSLL